MIGEDRMIHFSGCALNEACTIVLRGASECLACACSSSRVSVVSGLPTRPEPPRCVAPVSVLELSVCFTSVFIQGVLAP